MRILKILPSVFLIVIAGLIAAQNANAQSRVDRILIDEAARVTNDDFNFFVQTPRGARIYSVKQPSFQMLDAIDRGLNDLFAVSRKNNYFKHLNYSDYTIFVARADRTADSAKQYSPDIAVTSAQYAGSVYDQGGFVYAAGMVLAFNPSAFVIAEHTKNFERVSNVVRYEGEHLVLYHNDRRRYQQTADHSRGGGHPILQ